MSISRAGIKHRNLLEQPDVYFHGPLSFKIDGVKIQKLFRTTTSRSFIHTPPEALGKGTVPHQLNRHTGVTLVEPELLNLRSHINNTAGQIRYPPRSTNAHPRPLATTSKSVISKRGHDDPNSDEITVLPDNDDDQGETRTFLSSNDSQQPTSHPVTHPAYQTSTSSKLRARRLSTSQPKTHYDEPKNSKEIVTTQATISPVFERASAAQNQPGLILSPVADKKPLVVPSQSHDNEAASSQVTMLAKPIAVHTPTKREADKPSVRASTENIHQASQPQPAPCAVHKPASQSTSVASQTSQASVQSAASKSSSASSAHSTVPPPQHTCPIPPPPPPPAVVKSQPLKTVVNANGQRGMVNKKPTTVTVSAAKGAMTKLPDRRTQFVPEKNLFRIALECEEKATPAATDEEVIQDSSELASHFKGNIKSRIAFLEVNEPPTKAAAPNYSRPHKKDFMGELAERPKIRRQLVEKTCW
ncbi:hypothetical protein RvY_15324 [Ramazzottius varieornatus]|uniref:Uncharacterized protein n=1 Tax=Ramazzottius varieornatus TaxID=947166 RepID=A0A1D1VUH1_RAMVA|nr:hypothetical protein RvY_15324 [Ramazzottius varieornatus]